MKFHSPGWSQNEMFSKSNEATWWKLRRKSLRWFLNENEMSASKLQGCGDTVWQAGVSFISNIGFYVSLFDYNLII